MSKTTKQVAVGKRVAPGYLHYLIGQLRIPAPAKNGSGDYVWTARDEANIDKARALDRRRGKRKEAQKGKAAAGGK